MGGIPWSITGVVKGDTRSLTLNPRVITGDARSFDCSSHEFALGSKESMTNTDP